MYGMKGTKIHRVIRIWTGLIWFKKMSTRSLTYQQSVFNRYHSDRHSLQDGRKNRLALIWKKNYVTVTLGIWTLFYGSILTVFWWPLATWSAWRTDRTAVWRTASIPWTSVRSETSCRTHDLPFHTRLSQLYSMLPTKSLIGAALSDCCYWTPCI